MTGATIYACVNVNADSSPNIKIDSSKVLDFLKIIISYFKRLPSGSIVVDIGISGPIKRIIFGGNFGCNLLQDANVCSQFTKYGMKIYTMPINSNSFINNTNDSGNQMFVVDANVTSSSFLPISIGGGSNMENDNQNIVKRRLTIGELIQSSYDHDDKNQNIKLVVVNHKKKTRRRYKKNI